MPGDTDYMGITIARRGVLYDNEKLRLEGMASRGDRDARDTLDAFTNYLVVNKEEKESLDSASL